MVKFVDLYPSLEILLPLAAKLNWAGMGELLTISELGKRDFYLVLCARERWSKRTLRERIGSQLYERTLAASGSAAALSADITALSSTGSSAPSLVFRDPYVLDFLGVPARHAEADLERAILDEMRCYVAIELKTRPLEPGDYGQMMLYLRWLGAHQQHPGDSLPIGLIMCTHKGPEQVALLGLDSGEVRAAQYVVESVRAGLERIVGRMGGEESLPASATAISQDT